MVLKPISPACKVEAFADDDGTRLICNTVIEEDCPLGHAGVLGPDCFAMSMSSGDGGGSPPVDADPFPGVSTRAESITEDVPRPARHKRRRVARYGEMVMVNEDENMFEVEEEPQEPQPPKPPKKEPEPEPEDEDDEDDDAGFFEPLVEEFESLNGYSFGLTLLKDEDDEFFIDMQLDNVTVQLPVQDFMEMMSAFANALPGLGKAMTR